MARRSLGPRGSRGCRGSCGASCGAGSAAAGGPTRAARWSGRVCRVRKATCAPSLNRRPSFNEGAPPPQRTLIDPRSRLLESDSEAPRRLGCLLVRVSVVHFIGSPSVSQSPHAPKSHPRGLRRTMTPAPAGNLHGQRAAPQANPGLVIGLPLWTIGSTPNGRRP
jgi:hypothetical protein